MSLLILDSGEKLTVDAVSERVLEKAGLTPDKARKILHGALPPMHIPAHGVVLFAVRPIAEGIPAYIGSDLHISQGVEVTYWDTDKDGLTLRIERPGNAQGKIVLYLPKTPQAASINGNPCSFEAGEENAYYLPIEFSQSAELQLLW